MPSYPDLTCYIGGAWRRSRDSLPVHNPADESVIGAVPVAGMTGVPLQAVIGELMLAAIASALAIYGRGFIVPVKPTLTRYEMLMSPPVA